MHLDMLTMTAVNVAVTALLGAVLVFTWAREREGPFVGWWGLAQLVLAAGVLMAAVASLMNDASLVTLGTASMIFSAALKWKAARQFEYRHVPTLMPLAAPAAFLLAAHSGSLTSFDDRLILVCTVLAAFDLAAATELARGHKERLKSRWPAVILLVATAVSYVSWLPLILSAPIREAVQVFAIGWFPGVILLTVLLRVALSFLVLAMAKERQELKQRVGALTDPLTGLPNRRALFEAADLLNHNRGLVKGQPVSVLIFDLDRFKETNDSFGHAVGDRVLKIFAATLTQQLHQDCIVARVGGEEFAAILPRADPVTATHAAEAVRAAFASSAATVDGLAVAGTVSVGAASNVDVDCDLSSLFRRADAALYAAKNAGRNRVELIGPEDMGGLETARTSMRASRAGREPLRRPVESDAA